MSTTTVTAENGQEVAVGYIKPLTSFKAPKKLKPARKQVKPGQVKKEEPVQTGKEYNIWYNKWAGGDREDSYSSKVKSQTRCNIKRDQGLTRANASGMRYCCLFFARGCCPYGWECEYLHLLPDESWTLPDASKDCFARDKFVDYRDDMGGVGSFSRQNRTLYIGRIKETGPGPETEEIVIRHFKEWGAIEKIRVLQYRSVAFVTYVSELNAQFAKEAMACQSLDNDEILNVRWATEDPNPTSKVQEQWRILDMGKRAIQDRMDPKMIEAMRSVRALEEGVELKGDEDGEGKDGDDLEAEQRKELEALTGSDDYSDEEDEQPNSKRRRLNNSADSGDAVQAKGLLNADTIEGLKYFAEIRKRHEITNVVKQVAPPKPLASGLALDYGSDED
ncbi:CWC2 [Sanghuangporus weigelae]